MLPLPPPQADNTAHTPMQTSVLFMLDSRFDYLTYEI
ncbi:hypothetical protein PUN4_1070005 [Paraburkholderia unamae]|nr:hypothetical protein PUN4_1070005 [Paraburkholderia unamae]